MIALKLTTVNHLTYFFWIFLKILIINIQIQTA